MEGRLQLARLGRLAMIVLIGSMMSTVPAEAKKRGKRSNYSPPQAAMVVDAYSGKVLYAESADTPRYPASVTKVMTLYLLFEKIREGKLTLDSQLTVSEDAASRPPSNLNLEPGSTITVRDATFALVTKSANDVAAVIAENIAGSEAAFARLMTQKARAIGMSNTTFRNASGLPDRGQTTTARDLVTLGRRVLADFPEEAKIFRTRFFQYGRARYKNHNGLLFSYAGIEGMKTGYTRDSGFNLLTSCRRQDKHLIAVVLGGRSSAHRNARMRTLLNQAWSKAVASKDMKQRGRDKPVAMAAAAIFTAPAIAVGGALPGEMPERNPAFHGSVSERSLTVAMAAVRETEGTDAQEAAPARIAVAALEDADGKDAEAAEDDNAEEEGDTNAEARSSAGGGLGPYHVQVGSYLDQAAAKGRLAEVARKAPKLVSGHGELTVSGEVRGKSYFRARFGKFSEDDAAEACAELKGLSIDCLVVRAE